MPEKSGMDTAALVLLLVGRTSVGAVWPKAGDAIAVNAIHRKTSHGRTVMIVFLSKLANPHSDLIRISSEIRPFRGGYRIGVVAEVVDLASGATPLR
jgi:hypothetical protein